MFENEIQKSKGNIAQLNVIKTGVEYLKLNKSKHDKEHQVVFQQYLFILTQYKEVIQFLSLEAFCFIFISFMFNFDVQKFFSKKYSIYSLEN